MSTTTTTTATATMGSAWPTEIPGQSEARSRRFDDLAWRRSSYSNGAGGMCVEAAQAGDEIAVRDSKDPAGPVLVFTRGEWAAFLAGARDGEFDRP